jgi:amino acid adenylation domain-containing protein
MTVDVLIEEQCKKSPRATAVKFQERSLRYDQLGLEIIRMGAYLREMGIKKGDIIGLCVDRSIEMVVALIGIMKAGATYLPLDPGFPSARLKFMLNDSQCPFLITEKSLFSSFDYYGGRLVDIEEYKKKSAEEITPGVADEGGLAYLIYTSGSTGNPKGVQITQRSLINFLLSMNKVPGLEPSDTLLAITTLSFDISGLELLLPLITGAKLVIASREETKDGALLLKALRSGISVMQATPSTWKMLIDIGWKEKLNIKALCGGEELTRGLANELLQRVESLWNMYGPTETTIWSAVGKVAPGEGIVPLGKPIDNTQLYVVDTNDQLCAPGVPGELLIGGEGLSVGYFNRDNLTREKFIRNPFATDGRGRVYRTGDLVRLTSKFEVEFLGRIDSQVKIRGFRIELNEIESVIKNNQFIKDCAVVAKNFREGDKRLLAYVVIDSKFGFKDLSQDGENAIDWKDNWDNLYKGAIEKSNHSPNKSIEIGYLVVEQFEHDQKLRTHYNQWIEQTTERIRSLRPRRVLEIGCGGGDILKRIIKDCELYIATDVSQTIIDHLGEELRKSGLKLPEIRLLAKAADDDFPFEPNSFDTIIMNSVIQYFPNEEYLSRVIEKMSRLLAEGGCLFIGDVQSFSLMRNFNLFDQLRRMKPEITVGEFKQAVANKIRSEPEFFIDPDYFYSIKDKNSEISHIDIRLMRGTIDNEPVAYHYDTFIYKGKNREIGTNIRTIEWERADIIGRAVRILNEEKPDILHIRNIPNRRIMERKEKEELLERADNDERVNEVLNSTSYNDMDVDPEELWALESHGGYAVELILPPYGDQAHFDAIFKSRLLADNLPYPNKTVQEISLSSDKYCNDPSKNFFYEKVLAILRENALLALPEYMIPSLFIPIDSIPLTLNNKVDRKTLSDYEITNYLSYRPSFGPVTEMEKILLKIWVKLLGINGIGIDDNFFELGGHSILAAQMFTDLEKESGKRVPLAVLFTAQTIRQLAKMITEEKIEPIWSPLVEIKRGAGGPPLFLVHGAEGNVLLYRNLAECLDKDQAVCGLQSSGLKESDPMRMSIEEMAANYIEAMRKIQPTGPYHIGGYCMGGTIAYEIAQQLKAKGDETGVLFLIETYNIQIYRKIGLVIEKIIETVESLWFHFNNVIAIKGEDRKKFLIKKMEVAKQRTKARTNFLLAKLGIRTATFTGKSGSTLKIRKNNDLAQGKYVPTPYDGKAVLLKPKISYSSEPDPLFGWGKLITGEFKVYNLNVAPRGMLIEPYVLETASVISRELKR